MKEHSGQCHSDTVKNRGQLNVFKHTEANLPKWSVLESGREHNVEQAGQCNSFLLCNVLSSWYHVGGSDVSKWNVDLSSDIRYILQIKK